MAEGRNRRLWDHTATIAAAALSAFRAKMIDPARLHPYERGGGRSKGIPLTAGNIGLLKTVFVDAPRARKDEP
jgi:hypothetical protein